MWKKRSGHLGVERKEFKDGSRKYRVRFSGYDDPQEDCWYDEDDLRGMGASTRQMLDKFDEEQDAQEVLNRIAPKENDNATRKSGRKRKTSRK